ncbi:MAG: TetR/AcrR family transcriptional regulator C-terminal domain-containing protein [Acidimicrobiales bacterium]|nr:TetR/AcrR family transcriptional regulator C-terminal domain-containing protein [Acidimicrobiales bacterium]
MPAKERLKASEIVRVALEFADRDGLENLSMRKVAAHFDAFPMGIYHHVGDKAALLTAMQELAFQEFTNSTEDDGESWENQLAGLLRGYRKVLLDHPSVVAMLAQPAPFSPTALAIRDQIAAELRIAGFTGVSLIRAFSMVMSFISAFSVGLTQHWAGIPFGLSLHSDYSSVQVDGSVVSPRKYPNLELMRRSLPKIDADDVFEWGLELLLHGLALAVPARSR